jgi:pimeloyl-ACP methyl ester carboxylesterase
MGTHYLENENGKIAYSDTGSGPLVLCVPSMGDLRGEYRFLAPQLATAGFRAISMDVRGHGESSTGWDDYSVAGVGRDMLALIRSLNAGQAFIIGTSMAAGAAAWAAAKAPDLVRGIVLIGPFMRGGGDWLGVLLAAMFNRPWGPSMWLKYFNTLYPSHKPADFAEYTAALRENLAQPGRVEALQKMMMASKNASEECLPRVKTPALVLMGSQDPDFKQPETEARWVAESLHTRYQMIAGAGHYPHAEMPGVTGPLIVSFLKSLG